MIAYIIKSMLLLTVLFLIYKGILENEKMHRFNRYFLIFALVFGLTGPLLTFELSQASLIGQAKIPTVEPLVEAPSGFIEQSLGKLSAPEEVESPVETEAAPEANSAEPSTLPASSGADRVPEAAPAKPFPIQTVLLGIYAIVSLVLVIRLFGGVLNLIRKPNNKEIILFNKARLVLMDEKVVPHSFLNYVFLNAGDYKSGKITKEILEHELAHVAQRHSWDVLFIEFLKALFWFNPLLYLFKRSIQLNHEFLADDFALQSAPDVESYQKLLLSVSGKTGGKEISSNLNYGLFKKRLGMMGKRPSRWKSGLRTFLIVPLTLSVALMFCTEYKNPTKDGKLFITGTNTLDGSFSAEPELYRLIAQADSASGNGYYWLDDRTFSLDDEYFTGSQKYYNDDTGEFGWEEIFENGLLVRRNNFSDDSKDKITSWQEYTYENDNLISLDRYNQYGKLIQAKKLDYVNDSLSASRSFIFRSNNEEILLSENLYAPFTESGLNITRLYNQDGSLYFESQSKGEAFTMPPVYDGLMTKYEVDGTILEQELWKDGELIEKIK